MSISGIGAFIFSSRGEVRRARVVVTLVLCFSFEGDDLDVEQEEERDALDDIEVNGGRARVFGAGCGAFTGDDNVKSRVSIVSDERRSCDGVGTGASSNMVVVSRNFVGV